jgi:hypothetical protein
MGAGVVALLASSATAQTLGSGIVGTVKDESGAVVPGVSIELSSPALMGGTQTIYSDTQGQYRLVDLRPGIYALAFALDGFQTVRQGGDHPACGVHRDHQHRPEGGVAPGIGDRDRRVAARRLRTT